MEISVMNMDDARKIGVEITNKTAGVRERAFLAATIARMAGCLRAGKHIQAHYNPHFDRWKTSVGTFTVCYEASDSLKQIHNANCVACGVFDTGKEVANA